MRIDGDKSEIYEYPQENSMVTGLFMEIIQPLIEQIYAPMDILKLFVHFQNHNAHNREIRNPAAYNAAIDNKKYLYVLDDDYSRVYNQAYEALSKYKFETFEFMESFHACCSQSEDNSGVEHGFVLQYFLKSVKEKIPHAGISGKVIVCDPPPKFIKTMLKESWFEHKTALFYTENTYASAYFYEKALYNYDILMKESFPENNHTVCILILGDSYSPADIVSLLTMLSKKTAKAKEVYVYLYCPNNFIDGKEGKQTLHPYIVNNCTIDAVHIIDEKAFRDKQRKHSLLELRIIGDRKHTEDVNEICFSEVKLVEVNNVPKLISHNSILVPREMYDAGNKTLTLMYRSAYLQLPDNKKEKQNIYGHRTEFVFSDEIKGAVRVERTSSGKYRSIVTIQNKANARQKRENKLSHGSSIAKPIKGKSKRTREIAIDTAYEILLENENLRAKICQMLHKNFPNKTDYTIKTFWYVFWDKLINNTSYNHKVAIKMFCENQGVGNIKITKCTEADITDYLREMIVEEKSESYIRAVIRNLNCLFSILGKEYGNPCAGVLSDVTLSTQRYKEFRAGSVRRSFDMKEAKMLYQLFKSDLNTSDAGLARGGLISMFTPLEETEVCALRGENIEFVKSADLYEFKVTHTSDYYSTERTELLILEEQRVIPICRKLRHDLDVDSNPYMSNKPVVCDSDGATVTPKTLRTYISEKIKQVKIPKLIINLPGKGFVDLNDYRGNWLRSNFDFSLRNHGKISPEDLNYIMGRQFLTTDASHYRDYRCTLRQIAICTAIDRWAEKLDVRDLESNSIRSYIVNSKEEPELLTDSDPYMISTEVNMPQGEPELYLEFQSLMRFGGIVIIEELE